MSAKAKQICAGVARRIRYKQEPKRTDKWQTHAETQRLGTGDCEDFAILVAHLCLKAGIPCKVFLTYSGYTIGHAIAVGNGWYANNAEYAAVPFKDIPVHLARRMNWRVRPFLLEATAKILRGRGIRL